jgi:hypothetical protein
MHIFDGDAGLIPDRLKQFPGIDATLDDPLAGVCSYEAAAFGVTGAADQEQQQQQETDASEKSSGINDSSGQLSLPDLTPTAAVKQQQQQPGVALNPAGSDASSAGTLEGDEVSVQHQAAGTGVVAVAAAGSVQEASTASGDTGAIGVVQYEDTALPATNTTTSSNSSSSSSSSSSRTKDSMDAAAASDIGSNAGGSSSSSSSEVPFDEPVVNARTLLDNSLDQEEASIGAADVSTGISASTDEASAAAAAAPDDVAVASASGALEAAAAVPDDTAISTGAADDVGAADVANQAAAAAAEDAGAVVLAAAAAASDTTVSIDTNHIPAAASIASNSSSSNSSSRGAADLMTPALVRFEATPAYLHTALAVTQLQELLPQVKPAQVQTSNSVCNVKS